MLVFAFVSKWIQSWLEIETPHAYLAGVSGQNTWSRFYHTPGGLETHEADISGEKMLALSLKMWRGSTAHRMCRGYQWWEQICWGKIGSQRCQTGALHTGTESTDQQWRQVLMLERCERFPLLQDYLNDNFQGFDFLVCRPGLLQGLVQLFNAVGVILLREVKQLSLGTLEGI